MARKKKPTKKPAPLPPKLRAVRLAIEKATGDSRRFRLKDTRKANRFLARSQGRGALNPSEVMPKDDPRRPEWFTVCVYKGAAKDGELPIDVVKWNAAIAKYGISVKAAEKMRVGLIGGFSVAYASNVAGHVTFFPVLESGRAVDDIRRAVLLTSKAAGVLN